MCIKYKQINCTIKNFFLCKQFIQVTLPHSDPGHIPIWIRKNSNLILSIKQGYEKGQPIGYPFGSIPRLIIFWLTKEAIRTKSRYILLGENLSSFIKELGLNPSGGKRGNNTRLKIQMKRLFRADISLEYDHDIPGLLKGTSWIDMKVAKKGTYWWNINENSKTQLWDKWIELDEDFYDAITNCPIPLSTKALKVLKNSAMALDLYSWLTWRSFAVYKSGKSEFITWKSFNKQLGAHYTDIRNLRKKCKVALEKIKPVYPELKIQNINNGLKILASSRPSIY